MAEKRRKQIVEIIDNCWCCHHSRREYAKWIAVKHVCDNTYPERQIPDPNHIPNWCPLEDYSEKQ